MHYQMKCQPIRNLLNYLNRIKITFRSLGMSTPLARRGCHFSYQLTVISTSYLSRRLEILKFLFFIPFKGEA